jgi:uncharacterized membrane protein
VRQSVSAGGCGAARSADWARAAKYFLFGIVFIGLASLFFYSFDGFEREGGVVRHQTIGSVKPDSLFVANWPFRISGSC